MPHTVPQPERAVNVVKPAFHVRVTKRGQSTSHFEAGMDAQHDIEL
jgi:hypothetical protein